MNDPCPWLPRVTEVHDFSITRRHGESKGLNFYLDALRYAQSHWVHGKPAQALLQLNKAWMAELRHEDSIMRFDSDPYRALVWILARASSQDCGYLGNPVRHFQHFASRIRGPRTEIRVWRAWVCFHLAERVLCPHEFPRDVRQIIREGIWIPNFQRARYEVSKCGWASECDPNMVLDVWP